MYSETFIRQVQSLLAEGNMTQREIAAAVGVCRNTVARVNAGERAAVPNLIKNRRPKELSKGEVKWCSGCQNWISIVPCVYCAAMALLDSEIPAKLDPGGAADGLDLRPAEEARYRELRSGLAGSDCG